MRNKCYALALAASALGSIACGTNINVYQGGAGGGHNVGQGGAGGGQGGVGGGQGGDGGGDASLCGPGTTECSGVCVDTKVDPAHCGGCGQVCGSANATPFCSAGVCMLDCNAGFADCNGVNADG